MGYIKKEDLIKGEIYRHDNGNLVQYLYDYNDIKIYGHFIGDERNAFRKYNDVESLFKIEKLKLAEPEEKHWLLECIKLNKFITFEDAMKTFTPEYYKYIGGNDDSFTKNKIYKYLNPNNLEANYNFIDNKNTPNGWGGSNNKKFKPSTKEAYDAQFIVKEPKFILPEKWCIKQNSQIINGWLNINKQTYSTYTSINHNLFIHFPTIKHAHSYTSIQEGYTEITFEQFKKYVLKEEIVEEKVIEPLPQFKVIETIETITKVENNEGNQFFIGDKVKLGLLLVVHNITGFKYNEDKTKILAITNWTSIGIDINEIEHYIEPKIEVKEEFILPKKWCIKSNNDIEVKKVLEFKPIRDCNDSESIIFYRHFPTFSNSCTCNSNIKNGYTEITFDQFKKYVLKEDKQPIIIAESTKDILVLKAKDINSIVLPQETLLEKAERLYYIGTKFIPTQRGSKHTDTSSGRFREINGNIFHIPTGVSIYFNGKWAEIVK